MSYENNRGGRYEDGRTNYLDRGPQEGNQNKGGYNKGGFNKGNYKRPEDEGPIALYKPFVVTGNQNPPSEVINQLESILRLLDTKGFTARAGGFEGIEETVERVCTNNEIHLPWKGFNDKQSKSAFTTQRAKDIAKIYHSNFDAMSGAIQTFLGKNVRLAMGKGLNSPALFGIIWSADGAETKAQVSRETGNVEHIINIFDDLNVPLFNLANRDAEQRLRKHLRIDNHEQSQFSQQPSTQPRQQEQYESYENSGSGW